MEKRQVQRDPETQRRILDVAERLFLARGFKGVSMKDIAEEVKVTAAALYYYFPKGKQELFLNVIEHSMMNWTDQIFHGATAIPKLRQKLIYIAEAFSSFQISNAFTLLRDYEEYGGEKPKDRKPFQKALRQQLYLTEIFQQAIDTGEISLDLQASNYAEIFFGMVMGIQVGRHIRKGQQQQEAAPMSTTATATMIVHCLLDGISTRSNDT
ncbi:TetR/AcrR family transcriptional regulator [Dictyobacter arantiisoli]|uniref:HTH tetR-type domain-containing protein n=1 Tax=Dictyobacter arantiisoli TaxID=2014874 RepID=A0A5A5TE32_9CHLR|nr:TetR/AcrR family transcriptional regulator [Dictyobacter arantiisoli]GCF09577.1 hypothetical protein KDI_31410 [Dictyobacter arantiisoli]